MFKDRLQDMALLPKWSHQWNLRIRLFPGPSKTDGIMTELRRAHVFCKTTGSQEMGRESVYEQNMLSYSSHTYQLGISSHLSRSSICKEDRKNNNGAPKETQSEEKEFFMNSGVLKSVTQPLRPSICSSKKKRPF